MQVMTVLVAAYLLIEAVAIGFVYPDRADLPRGATRRSRSILRRHLHLASAPGIPVAWVQLHVQDPLLEALIFGVYMMVVALVLLRGESARRALFSGAS